jgi:ribonuclease P protein component
MSLRLTREAKILKPGEYTHIFKGGKRAKGKYWQIIAKPILDSRPRLGLAISKKVSELVSELREDFDVGCFLE